jgi:acetolactate synthase-1/2/3 large subunit
MIWVDGSYNMVAVQEELKYGRHSGTDLGPVDFVKYAEAFGATGIQVSGPDDLASALSRAFDTPGPVLLSVNVDYSKNAELFRLVHEGSIL